MHPARPGPSQCNQQKRDAPVEEMRDVVISSARVVEKNCYIAPHPCQPAAAWLTMEGLQLQGEMHDVRSRNKTAMPPQMLPERVIRPESPRSSPLEDGQPRATVDKKRGRRSTDALPLYGLPDGVSPA